MGDVYLAEHILLKRPCAIKLIKPERAGDTATLKLFEREVIATARLSHWNTVDIYDYGHTDDGTFFYVMELLDGDSLQALVARVGPMPPARVVWLLAQVCDALQEAHDAGMIHRDVKPANIFVTRRGGLWDVAKLLDFGLVKEIAANEASKPCNAGFSGTPAYMAPEQARQYESVDARADLYALGGVAHFLLAGQPPFSGQSVGELLAAHAFGTVRPFSQRGVEVPSDLEHIAMRCLAKSPADRFQSARQLGVALRACRCAADWDQERAATWWLDQNSKEILRDQLPSQQQLSIRMAQ
jgi:serine/threonine-protein kinase